MGTGRRQETLLVCQILNNIGHQWKPCMTACREGFIAWRILQAAEFLSVKFDNQAFGGRNIV